MPDDPTIGEQNTLMSGGPRTPDTAFDDTVTPNPSGPRLDSSSPSLPGYSLSGVIGRGGMGEVVRGHDNEIGRDVAIKRMRGGEHSTDAIARFLREAKIQARLEHPAIIPVHSIGRDTDGQPYFTMKRITGVTLGELLATKPPRQKILRALVDVCRCIDLAHSRRVVHRDLKPGNIMLGDYGEVYVLDWGLARVLDEGGDDEGRKSIANDVLSLDGSTLEGSMLGTPGYMPPEQVDDARRAGTPADIYALGSILFEILAGEPAHKKGEVLKSTMAGTDISPAKRAPDAAIPPELDALTIAALAKDPAKRPTARELADRIEGFLDGDRDLAARKRIATVELEDARRALESGDPKRRAEAVQAAGRALALDPSSRAAADLITSVILQPPTEQPPELRAHLLASEVTIQRRQGAVAMGSFSAVFVFVVLAALNGLASWPLTLIISGWTILLTWVALQISKREMTSREILLITLGNAALASLLSRTFGSLIIAPAVTCIMALSLTAYPQNIDRGRLVIALMVVSWIIPVLLEWLGILAPSWQVVHGAVISRSAMLTLGGTGTVALLFVTNILTIVVFGMFANKLALSRRDAQRQVEIQAWHLRQLLPS